MTARAELAPTATNPDNVSDVVIVRRVADPARRKKLLRLLSILMDKPDLDNESTPGDGGRR